ncbi:MAG: amidohydrolase family protein [Armatimonadota bacterium]|nr:amidohydrolase family protein [bacterium]MDW8321690.1 amidohydrolase family protein [Armatimonadota bacterium]
MIIDAHTHIGDLRSPANMHRKPITMEDLIARLDDEGIDKAILLPWPASPDGVQFPTLLQPQPDILSQIREGQRYPDRIILFGNVDPRWGGNTAGTDFSWLFERFVEMGCAGIGEIGANLPYDDPRVVNLFRQCGDWEFPVTIHATGVGEGQYGLIDEPGSPHLLNLLQQAPNTIIIGHGPGFWAQISADATPADLLSYPKGPIRDEGVVQKLLRDFPNLYADISAHSGFNALTRDPDYGARFLNEFQDKLLFGTDVCFGDDEGRMPQLNWLKERLAAGDISPEVYDKITCRNALKVLKRWRG